MPQSETDIKTSAMARTFLFLANAKKAAAISKKVPPASAPNEYTRHRWDKAMPREKDIAMAAAGFSDWRLRIGGAGLKAFRTGPAIFCLGPVSHQPHDRLEMVSLRKHVQPRYGVYGVIVRRNYGKIADKGLRVARYV